MNCASEGASARAPEAPTPSASLHAMLPPVAELPSLDQTLSGTVHSAVLPTVASVEGVASLAEADGSLAPLDRVGHYLILAKLGEGGMGVVFAAYDEKLDRKVAIKLLRALPGSDAQQRLVREAQALARLSHPNVVQVYEIGERGGQAFLAMEFVDGVTLRTWLRASPRSQADILAVFEAAGRGLAAAHAKGLVHRDFKPDNVMIAGDGRVVVMDFGLAHAKLPAELDPTQTRERSRAAEDTGELGSGSATMGANSSGRDSLSGDLTRTGALLGTPAYMAPEQFLAAATDARTDQFSFCVALWEALHGARPFRGTNVAALSLAIVGGEIDESSARTEVPSWLRRVLRRGLAVAPDARWPSMDALLAALARDPTRTRRTLAASVATLALVGAALLGAHLHAESELDQRVRACAAEGQAIAASWSPEIEAELARSFTSTEIGFAPAAWAATREQLDAYATTWAQLRERSCLATIPGHGSSDRDAQVRQAQARTDACLELARSSFAALVELLAKLEPESISRAPTMAAHLEPLSSCTDARALAQRIEPPADPQLRAQVAALRARIGEVRLLQYAGRAPDARDAARAIHAEAQALAWPPIEAEALYELGRSHGYANEFEQAIDAGERAFVIATESGHDLLALRAAVDLIEELSPEHERRRLWGQIALALSKRLELDGSPDEAGLFNALGNLAYTTDRFEQAEHWYRQALTLRTQLYGPDHPEVANSWTSLGNALVRRDDSEGGLAAHHEALRIWTRAVGPEHPEVATVWIAIASAQLRAGSYEQAIESFERARPIAQMASDPQQLALLDHNLGNVYFSLGRYEDAMASFRAAKDRWEAALGPDHYLVGVALISVADAELAQGHPEQAERDLVRAIPLIAATLGDGHGDLVPPLHSLATALRELGRHDEALAALDRARPLIERNYGPDDPDIGLNSWGQAESYAAKGELERARELGRDAVERLRAADSPYLDEATAWLVTIP
jgi:eukaryotic-like serine/threonine-protein kinase